jgi:transmembrane sensor
MTNRPLSEQIDREAAQWAAKRQSGPLTAEQVREFERWLGADIRNLGAYARAEAVLAQFDRVGAAGINALRPSPAREAIPIFRRRNVLVGSAAAGLCLAALGGGIAWRYLLPESYSTNVGETRPVLLPDGSVVTLNTDSRINVRYSKARRFISLVQGEALFEVAKNRQRPFIVDAGDTHVLAVGTQFTVERLPNRPVIVLVREGVVEVSRPKAPEASPVRLAANEKAVAPLAAPISAQEMSPSQVMRDLAWREGRIAFDNQTLKDAQEEFARYSDIRIVIDPSLENRTVTGLFVTTDPVGFARAAALSLDLRAEVSDRTVYILPK